MSRPLSRRSARTLYNVADALLPPPKPGEPGAGDLDVAPFVEQRIRWGGVGVARRCWLLLTWIEWQPVLTLRARRGFSRLPRERRRALLRTWQQSRVPARRRAFEGLREWVEAGAAEARGRTAAQSSGA